MALTSRRLSVVASILLLLTYPAVAQTRNSAKPATPPAAAAGTINKLGPASAATTAALPQTTPPKPAMPGVPKLTLLVQTHMAALAHAIGTGNYSVFLALSSPDFQRLNPPVKLEATFSGFRERNIDLLPIVLYQPILVAEPAMDQAGRLSLKGYYATEPQQVTFELMFQSVDGIWRLAEISAGAQPKRQAGVETMLNTATKSSGNTTQAVSKKN